jgi:hypothetical protein
MQNSKKHLSIMHPPCLFIILAKLEYFFILNQSDFSSSGKTSKYGKTWGFVQALLSLRAATQANSFSSTNSSAGLSKKYNWCETNGKACGLIFQNGGSHKPNYIYISFYQNNIIIKVFNYF